MQKAVELGYKILNIYEVWHYEHQSQYDRETGTGGLVSGYITTIQGQKQEASCYPEWAVDDKTKDEYIAQYKEREGIKLNKAKIAYYSGSRSLEKSKLNNLWGNLCKPIFPR